MTTARAATSHEEIDDCVLSWRFNRLLQQGVGVTQTSARVEARHHNGARSTARKRTSSAQLAVGQHEDGLQK